MTGRPDDGSDPLSELADSPAGALARRLVAIDTTRIVLAITAVALLIRFVGLGTRPMHYDESRVAYWILHYVDTGSFTYRHGIHGPFIQHVNHWLFPLLGPSDFTARLPVAVVGGLLPAVALLFREHLKRSELIALALFLSFNSLLVYYSRFMRSDILLAGFMFLAFGLLVRFYDTRDVRYLYGLAVFAAFGFATKENALVYALTWVGATGLLADQALFRPRKSRTGIDVLQAKYASLRGRWRDVLPHYVGHVVGAIVVFLLVLVFMYADRGAGIAGIRAPPASPEEGAVGFWEALASPVGFPGYAYDTLAASFDEALQWGGRGAGGDSDFFSTYAENIGTDLNVLATNAPVLLVFAVLGFVWERYGRANARNLVMFAGYWGFVSVLGYPLADDIGSAHWLHVHILVPLSIPAAVAGTRPPPPPSPSSSCSRASRSGRPRSATATSTLPHRRTSWSSSPSPRPRCAPRRWPSTVSRAPPTAPTSSSTPTPSTRVRGRSWTGRTNRNTPSRSGRPVRRERGTTRYPCPGISTLPARTWPARPTPATSVYLHEDRVDEVPGWETAGDDPSR
ncbi:hypothetical protein BRD09_02615 [Halobacteriales archaeon SW_10_68_16]|nr:MAG: hypothetical protein BRD09_02615 [Halobacteriales archaeon SW_10_68_16]